MSQLTPSRYFTDLRTYNPATPRSPAAQRAQSDFERLSYSERLAQGRELLRRGFERLEEWDDETALLRGKGKRFNLTVAQTKHLNGIENERANLARLLQTLEVAMQRYSVSRDNNAA
jgi:hypothetical protein